MIVRFSVVLRRTVCDDIEVSTTPAEFIVTVPPTYDMTPGFTLFTN